MTVIRTAVDTWADQARPGTELGDTVFLSLNGGAGTNNREGFVHFALPAAIIGSTILSAKLRLYTRKPWASSQVITAQRITQKWSERKLNWNNRPSASATNQAQLTVASAAADQLIELDVGAMLGDVAGGSAFFGFKLTIDLDVTRGLHSAESILARWRPQLELVYSLPPDAPTPIGPQGGRAVSIALPTMRWVFRDPDSGSAQASYRVQVDDAADFATVLADTGKVAGAAELAISPLSIAVNDVRYWRVMVWDDADVASAWTDPVSFTRKAKGSLVIASPSGSTVDDLSPPIAWTFTPPAGATQESYTVDVYELSTIGSSGILRTVHNSGKLTGAATSYTLPEGIIVSGKPYRAIVRVWDTIDRDAYATDFDYVEAQKDFTYARSGAPVEVLTLTAVQTPTNGPGVLLTWTRAAQPDYFTLKVNGVEVLPRIDPSDVFVSGTTYTMKWWGAIPRVATTYEVEAVVLSAGKLQNSDANATASLTVQLDGGGVWLVDEYDDTVVRIAGSQGPDLAIGESGQTHFLRGRRDPVRIVDTIRGYEGDVSGLLRSKADRDTFLALKGRTKTLRMIAGDLNIPVVLEEASTGPTHVPHDRVFTVAFGVLQVDGFTFDVVGS